MRENKNKNRKGICFDYVEINILIEINQKLIDQNP